MIFGAGGVGLNSVSRARIAGASRIIVIAIQAKRLERGPTSNVQHPTYKALCELGKALKTVFLCDCLQMESLRREIQERLNVVENWNSANDFILYGKGGEFAGNRLEDQEILMLALHLLQVSLVYVNTLMIQQGSGGAGVAGPPHCG